MPGANRKRKSVRLKTRPTTGRVKPLSTRQIRRALAQQRAVKHAARVSRRAYGRAKVARDRYKPRKGDRGKLVLIGVKGQRNPAAKGRKGYLVYVTRTGKKWLIKTSDKSKPFAPRKLTDIEPPHRKNLRRAVGNFQRSKLVTVARGQTRAVVKGRGSVTGMARGSDFNESVINTIARKLKRVIEAQRSQRAFLIKVGILIELAGGGTQRIEFSVPIDKADHITIRLDGLKNFVRFKFYAFMARELMFFGYITSGSANHIRRVMKTPVDAGVWEDYHAQNNPGANLQWDMPRFEVVKILAIEYEIQQAK